MAVEQQITFNSTKGITVITSRARSISEALESAELTSRTAAAIRLLHTSARQPSNKIPPPQAQGTEEVFLCACGESFNDGWDAVAHCESHHVSAEIRCDVDRTEDVIRALVVPDPLPEWDSQAVDVVVTRTFGDELISQIAQDVANYEKDQTGKERDGLVTEEHRQRASILVSHEGWDKVEALTYRDAVESILEVLDGKRDEAKPKIKGKEMQETFLLASARFFRDFGRCGVKKE